MATAQLEGGSDRWRSAAFRILLLTLTLAIAYVVAINAPQLIRTLEQDWLDILFWSGLVAIVNLLPVRVGSLFLTLDTPVVLAVAFVYPPAVAAIVALVATVDKREFTKGFPLTVALFNRLQTSAAVLLAGWWFHLVGGLDAPLPQVVVATMAALAVDYCVNVVFIVTYQVLNGVPSSRAFTNLRVGESGRFLALYLSYGALALVLALLFLEVGSWAAAAFFIPIMVARQSLIRAQELEALAAKLQSRERLMEQLLDRMVDERRDERLRIASDLHDNVLQSLIRIWMVSQILQKEEKVPPSRRDIEELYALSDDSIQSLRALMREMRNSPLARGGLISTLEGLVRDLRLDWGMKIELRTPRKVGLPANDQIVLYQVAREALMNAVRHSRASLIRVELTEGPPAQVIVRDDGSGFEPSAVDESVHFGLGLMRERLRHSGGELEIRSALGSGTQVKATLQKPNSRPRAATRHQASDVSLG